MPASAKFSMGSNDMVWEIGDGPAGAVVFAKGLSVSDFQFTMMLGGPTPPVSDCSKQEVSLMLLQAGGKQAFEATFRFKDGQLTEAWAHDTNLFAGKIEPK